LLLLPPPHTRSTLFPYTTLFRSIRMLHTLDTSGTVRDARGFASSTYTLSFSMAYCMFIRPLTCISSAIFLVYSLIVSTFFSEMRSEEHTSELQSRFDLVCRLLLE